MTLANQKDLSGRLRAAEGIASGKNPIVGAAYYDPESLSATQDARAVLHPWTTEAADQTSTLEKVRPKWLPIATPPTPNQLTASQQAGEWLTTQMLKGKWPLRIPLVDQIDAPTNGIIRIHDGFTWTKATKEGAVEIFFDTETDAVLAAIIHRAAQKSEQDPNMSVSKFILYVSLLCFGEWGQQKRRLSELQLPAENKARHYLGLSLEQISKPRFYLGEFIRGLSTEDLDCSMFATTLQVVLQQFTKNGKHEKVSLQDSLLYLGKMARLGIDGMQADEHACVIIEERDERSAVVYRCIDLALFPFEINELFALAGTLDFESVWTLFQQRYRAFPVIFRSDNPPNYATLSQVIENPDLDQFAILSSTQTAHYFSDPNPENLQEEYLYSCRIPTNLENTLA